MEDKRKLSCKELLEAFKIYGKIIAIIIKRALTI